MKKIIFFSGKLKVGYNINDSENTYCMYYIYMVISFYNYILYDTSQKGSFYNRKFII